MPRCAGAFAACCWDASDWLTRDASPLAIEVEAGLGLEELAQERDHRRWGPVLADGCGSSGGTDLVGRGTGAARCRSPPPPVGRETPLPGAHVPAITDSPPRAPPASAV